ncbi:serine hydrolase [Longilinea arvoryzae]|nr:serine hydrolase [Longilinea arvoryzae]
MLLLIIQLVTYSRIRSNFALGTVIAGVPVGGLDQQEAAERLTQAYSFPVEIHYGDAVIQIKPSVVGFDLGLETMLAVADQQRVNQAFWSAFWDYLWNRLPTPSEVPLRATFSEERLRAYLKDEIASRYDQPAAAAQPVPGSTNFSTGAAGLTLDVDRAVTLIGDALRSPDARVVNLSVVQVSPPRPSFQNLQILLQQVIDASNFDGLTELYLMDLQTGQELNFAYQNGETVTPGIAFTAASTMKIPIMVSTFKRTDEPLPSDLADLMTLMIERSENDPADRLMEQVMDPNLGPLELTQDMEDLGLPNTFLAGYFYAGAPLLQRFSTPANQRTDVYTSPDAYNQTTPAEMGMLLSDIYQCSQTGGGTFAAVFPGKISQNECRQMINYLVLDKIGVLLQAGLPEGTQFAHKHGWVTDPTDGVIHTISDAGIVYSSGGNYILTVYVYHPTQVIWDQANVMVAKLSMAVYNYYNLAP